MHLHDILIIVGWFVLPFTLFSILNIISLDMFFYIVEKWQGRE